MSDGWGYSPLDPVLSPFVSLADTVADLPGLRDTGLGDWISDTFPGVFNFREQEPGWALAGDVAASFVPFVGWDLAATRLSTAALRARGLASTTPALTALGDMQIGLASRAARLFPDNPVAATALGESARFLPLAAGMTGLDYAAGNIDEGGALLNLGLGTVGFAGLQAAGLHLSPAVNAVTARFGGPGSARLIGGAWKAVFEPPPSLAPLYGFSGNLRAAATAANPTVMARLDPKLSATEQSQVVYDLIREIEANPNAPEFEGIDLPTLQNVYQEQTQQLIRQVDRDRGPLTGPDATREAFRFESPVSSVINNAMRDALVISPKPAAGANRVRIPLDGRPERVVGGKTLPPDLHNPTELANHMGLPEEWIRFTSQPGITQATIPGGPRGVGTDSAGAFRIAIGLNGDTANGFRTLTRTAPDGSTQVWSIRREADDGLYFLATEIPVRGGEAHRMTGRRLNSRASVDDINAPAKWFLSFKTNRPEEFFPMLRADFDAANPMADTAFQFADRINPAASKFLNAALQYRKVFLNKNTIDMLYDARLNTAAGRQKIIGEMLGAPQFGRTFANWFEAHVKPAAHQLENSPEGRQTLAFYQAMFDMVEGRKNEILYGVHKSGENPLASLLPGSKTLSPDEGLIPQLRKAWEGAGRDDNVLEEIRQVVKGLRRIEELDVDSPARKWLEKAEKVNNEEIEMINGMVRELRRLGATDLPLIPTRARHYGISHSWDGSVFVPIYRRGAAEPDAVVAGVNETQAISKAQRWIQDRNAWLAAAGRAPEEGRRIGSAFIPGRHAGPAPGFVQEVALNPKLMQPRTGMMGYENQYRPYGKIDEFFAELENNYTRRWRYAGSTAADALTISERNKLFVKDGNAYEIVTARANQMKGVPGQFEEWQNKIVDGVLAPVFGTQSASKIADTINGAVFHLLHGVGRISTPLLNLTSVLQTQLPAATNFLTARPEVLARIGYMLPKMDANGRAVAGFNWMADPQALLRRGVGRVINPSDADREVIDAVWGRKIMGESLSQEFVGQNRYIAEQIGDIKSSDDLIKVMEKLSSLPMAVTERMARVKALGMSLEMMDIWEKAVGKKFTMDQKINNALTFIHETNYGYFKHDRPQMFTGPMGSVFGNQKTWMVNYLFQMVRYMGNAVEGGPWQPALMGLGTTALLGGVLAVPFAKPTLDALSTMFTGEGFTETTYGAFGDGPVADFLNFGAPAMIGISLSQNVAAPGSHLTHDAQFLFTVVALERAKLMARAVGRGWDDQVVLGMNPMQDPVFQQQAIQAFAPRAVYGAWNALVNEHMRSATTGYPLVRNLTPGQRIMTAMGFQTTDIALQYELYDSLLQNKTKMREMISQFGEAYAFASMAGNQEHMQELLSRAAMMGLDVSSVMRSAQVRMRNAGRDMFGRQFNSQQLEQYQEALEASGRPYDEPR